MFILTSHSFETQDVNTIWKILNIPAGKMSDLDLSSDASDIVWVGPTNTSVLYIHATRENNKPGTVTLWTTNLADSPLTG